MKKAGLFVVLILAVLTLGQIVTAALVPPLIGQGTKLVVSLVNVQPDPVAPGEKLEVRIKIENHGSAIAEAVLL